MQLSRSASFGIVDPPLLQPYGAANVRVVNIDASKPWSTTLEGVSVAFEPQSDVQWTEGEEGARNPSVYFWLSPANGGPVIAEIVAADFMRLSPADSVQIARNLAHYRQQLLELKREYEVKLATLLDLTVFALAPEFIYLTSDMGLFVDGYFLKQDINWTDEDVENFESYLEDNDIEVCDPQVGSRDETDFRTQIDSRRSAVWSCWDMIDLGNRRGRTAEGRQLPRTDARPIWKRSIQHSARQTRPFETVAICRCSYCKRR